MSWQPAAFAVLALALAGGAFWYERTRPPAKVVALVATLGALAALGRIAFAPLPNVKPTTDIVLVAGVALGGAPAFVVGAVAALASNLFFGQGYWTPWQMLAWGMVGLFGGLLGRLAGRRVGRWRLAAAGAVAGIGFGAIMNFSTWVNFSDHSLEAYLAMASSALPFDIAHAVGNVLFALAFGPALLGAITRFRERFEVTWRPAAATVAPAGLVIALALAAAAPEPARAASSVSYLARAQNPDGGWGAAPGQASNQLHTGWVALGLAAAGRNPLDVQRNGRSPISFIRKRGAGAITDVGELERTIMVAAAAGLNPRRFAGRDLVRELGRFRRRDGSFSGYVSYTSYGVLALRAAGRSARDPTVRRATAWVARQQNTDGGFNVFRRGGASGIDDTAGAVQALAAGGRAGSRAVSRAAAFLRRQQNADGGFPLVQRGPSNAQSTAYAVLGLLAAGVEPNRVRRGGRSPLGYLRSLTAANGSVRYSRTSTQTPTWVTAQALLALSRKPLPLRPVPRGRGGARGGASAAAAGKGAGAAESASGRGGRARAPGSDADAARIAGVERLIWVRRAGPVGFAAGTTFSAIS